MAMSPSQIADKWARNTKAATQSMKDGVMAVTESPMEKAAARSDAMVAGVQRAVNEGRWQAGLRRVTTQQWKDRMISKGIPRVAQGVTDAQPEFATFMSDFLPFVQEGQRQLEATPRGDLQTNINRMVQMIQHLSEYRRPA